MEKLEQTWRWFGTSDPVSLSDIRQAGATGIVSALHHLPNGVVWPEEEIQKHKNLIEDAGLRWSVVESIPVHEEIKQQGADAEQLIENYKASIRNLAACGISTVCYNFMPVLDWTRTDLHHPFSDGATGLRFDEISLAAFDLFLLKRDNAENDYTENVCEQADVLFQKLTSTEKQTLVETILAGLPGSEEGYTLDQFREALGKYSDISEEKLRLHLHQFVQEIAPAAEEAGVKLAIHPDDPPFPLFGLPRVVSTEEDVRKLFDAAPGQANGLTFCTGSFGVREDNNLPEMVKNLGERIHFVHLRNVQREGGNRSFHEAAHLNGSTDMAAVMRQLIEEQIRRRDAGREDIRIPFRPDHGHRILSDFSSESNPGYPGTGRMRGLAELRGLEEGIRSTLL